MRWYENISTFYNQILISFGQLIPRCVAAPADFQNTLHTSVLSLPLTSFSLFYLYGVLSYSDSSRTQIHAPWFLLDCSHTAPSPNANLVCYLFKYPCGGYQLWEYIYIHIYLICRNIMLESVSESVTMWNELYIKNTAVVILAFFSTHQSTSIWSVISDLHWYEMLQGSLHPGLQTHSRTHSPPPILPLTQPVGSEPSLGI